MDKLSEVEVALAELSRARAWEGTRLTAEIIPAQAAALLAHINNLNAELSSKNAWLKNADAKVERLETEKANLIVSLRHLEERTRQAEHEVRALFNDDAIPTSAIGVMPQQAVQEGFVVVPVELMWKLYGAARNANQVTLSHEVSNLIKAVREEGNGL